MSVERIGADVCFRREPRTAKEAYDMLIISLSTEIKEKQIIINHGFLNANELVLLYSEKKAIVYAAVNESLGLGIIEALNYGCDLIGPDLEYIHSICNPSVSYKPFDLNDFVFCLKEYDVGTKPKSVLKIENKMQDIIKLLQYEYVQK